MDKIEIQTRRALETLRSALTALEQDVRPVSPERFDSMSGPIRDHIRRLEGSLPNDRKEEPPIILDWAGPSGIGHQDDLAQLEAVQVGRLSGLYLWTIVYRDGYLINYVGETGRPFSVRHREHLDWSLEGKEHLVDLQEFLQGRRNVIRRKPGHRLVPGTAEYEHMLATYRCYRVFVAPLNADAKARRQNEQGILRQLQLAGGTPADFVDNSKRALFGPTRMVRMRTSVVFHGLPQEFDC